MLNDISAVKTWDKLNSGMIKMYMVEVLGKLPVVQHFLFGSLLPYQGIPPPTNAHSEDPNCGHVHPSPVDRAAAGWGDCCGIPIPSAFGAAAEEAEKRKGGKGTPLPPGVRPVPFD